MSPPADRGRLLMATTAVADIPALDVVDAGELSRGQGTSLQPSHHAVAVRKAVTVGRPPEELYRVRGAAEWDAEIIDDRPNQLIGWRRGRAPGWRTRARCASSARPAPAAPR